MSQNQQREIERLKKLRDQQLTARDPHKGTRTSMQAASEHMRKRRKFKLAQVWKEMKKVYQGLIIGLIFGTVLGVIIGFVWPTSTGAIVALLGLLIPTTFSVIIGAGMDWRDEMRRLK